MSDRGRGRRLTGARRTTLENQMSVHPGPPPNVGGDDPPPTWRWLFADEAGVVVTVPETVFDTQEDAEGWLRDEFEELAEDGIATVTLMDGEHAVYGPMYLAADGAGPAAEAEF